jgi:hypothetical protein
VDHTIHVSAAIAFTLGVVALVAVASIAVSSVVRHGVAKNLQHPTARQAIVPAISSVAILALTLSRLDARIEVGGYMITLGVSVGAIAIALVCATAIVRRRWPEDWSKLMDGRVRVGPWKIMAVFLVALCIGMTVILLVGRGYLVR